MFWADEFWELHIYVSEIFIFLMTFSLSSIIISLHKTSLLLANIGIKCQISCTRYRSLRCNISPSNDYHLINHPRKFNLGASGWLQLLLLLGRSLMEDSPFNSYISTCISFVSYIFIVRIFYCICTSATVFASIVKLVDGLLAFNRFTQHIQY